MSIRLHPATPHGDRVHRWAASDPADSRVCWTFCGVKFAWGTWKGTRGPLPRCVVCWP